MRATATLKAPGNVQSCFFRQFVRRSVEYWNGNTVTGLKVTRPWGGDGLVTKSIGGQSVAGVYFGTRYALNTITMEDNPGDATPLSNWRETSPPGAANRTFVLDTADPGASRRQALQRMRARLEAIAPRTYNVVRTFETYLVQTSTGTPIGYLSWGVACQYSVGPDGEVSCRVVPVSKASVKGQAVPRGGWDWIPGVDNAVWGTFRP
jgi:hypothetical protein